MPEVRTHSERDEFLSRPSTDAFAAPRDVTAHATNRDAECGRDLFVGLTRRQRLNDFALPLRDASSQFCDSSERAQLLGRHPAGLPDASLWSLCVIK